MADVARRAYRRLMHLQRTAMDALPPQVAAGVDRCLPVLVRPMNGQGERQQLTRAIARAVRFDRVIETGTYRGGTTRFLADTFDVPVASVEAVPRYHAFARRRLAGDPRVELAQGDSREFLRRQADRAAGRAPETVFFYLDAHWENDLPLAEELAIIAGTWNRAVVMIDDFEVPGDPDYGFDDYGPGKALVESYLPAAVSGWTRFYPLAPGRLESGARRGCVVLVSPELGERPVPDALRRAAAS